MKRNPVPKRKKLGEILVQQGRVTPDQLNEILRLQRESGKPLGQILVDKEILSSEELTRILGEQLGIPHVWLRKGLIDPRVVPLLPKEKAVRFQVIPMFRIRNTLTLATADPHAFFVFDEVGQLTGLEVHPVLCRTDDILEAINQYYQGDLDIDDIVSGIDDQNIELVSGPQEKEITEIAEMAEGSPVINLTNMILVKAIRDGASDIHLEPHPTRFRVRVRIDGLLYDMMSPRLDMQPGVVSRLKVMSNLDISERRIPQDGRIQVSVDGQKVDLRFSSMPGVHGEKVVLRILDQRKAILDLNKLGLGSEVLDRFKTLLRKSHGLILVCGPTGSGKTTTLYSAMTLLNTPEKNIITIEDPVEYQLENINQNQVNESIGLSYAKFLKHALRQDPDIILVGEIRDRATAEIAIQASLTGHLVLSTLHTNDSASAVTRLLEMEIEPYLISSSLLVSVAQRLVRTICPGCKTSYAASPAVLEDLGIEDGKRTQLTRGRGCQECYDSGFKGRTGIYELMEIDDDLRALILGNPTSDALQSHFLNNGHKSMKDFGYERVLEGVTTLEEVKRVTSAEM
jgi:type IV pilus assembly protein PilB